jgi:hypothetical protein
VFENCVFVNSNEDRCVECKPGYFLVFRHNKLSFCSKKHWWENGIAYDILATTIIVLAIVYGLWLVFEAIRRDSRASKERKLQLETQN